jgi:glycosyltransferase involved in cell wall biosynthesis
MIIEKLSHAADRHVLNGKLRASLNIVFMAHPDFCNHVSMPRFHTMLLEGMRKRGHRVQTLTPKPRFHNLPVPGGWKKWLGYIDQFILFPRDVKQQMNQLPDHTLFVFTDNALGPWVPLAAHMPHVIHCHDFMAQKAALGQIDEQRIKWSGRQYQRMIRDGYSMGLNFVSGSENTRRDLLKFLPGPPKVSELVYNGLHTRFMAHEPNHARTQVSKQFGINLMGGYLLHVGGNMWYKNRVGVIEIYDAWRKVAGNPLPLLLIGLPPSREILDTYNKSPYKGDIHFITNASDAILNYAYSAATVFLFPSKAEGFGWPIAEAMSAGCPVLTTDEAPMTEVGGDAGFYIPRRPNDDSTSSWARNAGLVVERIASLTREARETVVAASIRNAKRFDTDHALDRIEAIYLKIVEDHVEMSRDKS